MGRLMLRHTIRVALSLVGSAILLFSCKEPVPEIDTAADEALMTEYSENLTIVNSQNGKRSYRFTTPLLEGYMQAREPYREFRKGVEIVTYQDDSLSSVDVVLTANYAIYYEKRKLWEAKGNVVVQKYDGKTLYTQQLFWNATTKKVYSNVDSKVVRGDGRTAVVGTGFESDDEFKEWRFRHIKGRTEVDVAPREQADSVQTDSIVAPAPMAKPTSVDREERKRKAREAREARNAQKQKESSGTTAKPATFERSATPAKPAKPEESRREQMLSKPQGDVEMQPLATPMRAS